MPRNLAQIRQTRGSGSEFRGIPKQTLLELGALPIEEIAGLTIREGHRSTAPYNIHRWFARRLSSQFRSLLAAVTLRADEGERFWDTYLNEIPLEGALLLDPFSGGGTSLVEGLHCNARVIGYDIDPVATFVARMEVSLSRCTIKESEIDEICAPIAQIISDYHISKVAGIGDCEVLHHFWVEKRNCPSCSVSFEIHPHYQLARNPDSGFQWVFCRYCHAIYKQPIHVNELECRCGARTTIREGTLENGKTRCPSCDAVLNLSEPGLRASQPPEWFLFAQEYIRRTPAGITRHFKSATDEDRSRYEKASLMLRSVERNEAPFAPARQIPHFGRSDKRPLIHGFKRYRDLFNDRQLLHLTLLGKAIQGTEDQKLKRILALAFSEHLTTNCMYTAYAFGYRRTSPMFSVHAFRHIVRPVEINPWLKRIGRGTFPNVLDKILKAIQEAKTPHKLSPLGGRFQVLCDHRKYPQTGTRSIPSVLARLSRAAIVTSSSENLSQIPNDSVDLILTDPPYYDNISYSELSDFYLSWQQALGVAEAPYDDDSRAAPLAESLAAENKSEEAFETYRTGLFSILSECFRVLNPNGMLVFTYHHKSPAAWYALGSSLAGSGFKCTRVLPLRGEGQGGLHSQSGTIKWDAVFACRKSALMPRLLPSLDDVYVPPTASKKIKLAASKYYERFKSNENLGFREPDRLNLERALISAAAFVGETNSNAMPLHKMLNNTKLKGGGGKCLS